jgi:hypothetical protein
VTGPPLRDLHSLRVMVCESELRAYLERYPGLTREQVFEVMLSEGPSRAGVEAALAALAAGK